MVRLVHIPSVFTPQSRMVREVAISPGETALDLARRKLGRGDGAHGPHHFIVHGRSVPASYELREDDELIAITMPETGIEIGAMLAYLAISTAVSLALSFAFMALFPPPKPPETQEEGSSTNSWLGIRNTHGQGAAISLTYGEHPIGGQILMQFRKNTSITTKTNFLYMLISLGQGVLDSIGQYDTDMDHLCPKGSFNDLFSDTRADLDTLDAIHPQWNEIFGSVNAIGPNGTVAVAVSTIGLAINIQDASNFHYCFIESNGAGGWRLKLNKRVAGANTTLGTVDPYTLGDKVALWRYDDVLHVEVEGVEVITADADLAISAFSVGLVSGVTAGYRVRDDIGLDADNCYVDGDFMSTTTLDNFTCKAPVNLPEGLKINDVDGNTFRYVTAWLRLGRENQVKIGDAFKYIVQAYHPDVSIRETWTEYSFVKEVEGFQLVIEFPRGLYDASGGTPINRSVSIAVEYRPDSASPWTAIPGSHFVLDETELEPFTKTIEYYPVTPLSGTAQQVRLRRINISADLVGIDNIVDRCVLADVNEIEGTADKAYEGLALLALKIKATEQLKGSQVPKVITLHRGLSVPMWNVESGSVTEPNLNWGYSNNPAWIALDIALNPKRGLGNRIKVHHIDWAKWKAFADWCDEELTYQEQLGDPLYSTIFTEDILAGSATFVVDDDTDAAEFDVGDYCRIDAERENQILTKTALGGGRTQFTVATPAEASYAEGWTLHKIELGPEVTDKRFEFNGVFDESMGAWEAIRQVLAVGRGVPMFVGELLSLRWEGPASPVQLITEANMIEKSFSITHTGKAKQVDEIQVQFLDSEQNWDKAMAEQGGLAIQFGENALVRESVNLTGCTSARQARREGWYQLQIRRKIKRKASWRMSIDGLASLPGDVVKVGRRMPDWSHWTGRGSGNLSRIYLSQPITLESGITYLALVRTPANPEGVEVEITSAAGAYAVGTVIETDSTDLTSIVDSVIAIGPATKLTEPWRFTDGSNEEDFIKSIEAVEYDESIYDPPGWPYGDLIKPPPVGCIEPGSFFYEFTDCPGEGQCDRPAPPVGQPSTYWSLCDESVNISVTGAAAGCVDIGRVTENGFIYTVGPGCEGLEFCIRVQRTYGWCHCTGGPFPKCFEYFEGCAADCETCFEICP